MCKFIVLFENIIIQKCKKGKEEIGVFGGGFGQNIKIGKESAGKLFIGLIAPNLVVMSFSCDSPVMSFFEEKVLQISEPERLLLAQIIQEAKYVLWDSPGKEKSHMYSK